MGRVCRSVSRSRGIGHITKSIWPCRIGPSLRCLGRCGFAGNRQCRAPWKGRCRCDVSARVARIALVRQGLGAHGATGICTADGVDRHTSIERVRRQARGDGRRHSMPRRLELSHSIDAEGVCGVFKRGAQRRGQVALNDIDPGPAHDANAGLLQHVGESSLSSLDDPNLHDSSTLSMHAPKQYTRAANTRCTPMLRWSRCKGRTIHRRFKRSEAVPRRRLSPA